jgi:hypothetical protein
MMASQLKELKQGGKSIFGQGQAYLYNAGAYHSRVIRCSSYAKGRIKRMLKVQEKIAVYSQVKTTLSKIHGAEHVG